MTRRTMRPEPSATAVLEPAARATSDIATSIRNARLALDLTRRGRVHHGLVAAEAHIASLEVAVETLLRTLTGRAP